MRHSRKGRKLNRTWSHRKAMLRNMVTTFLDREEIETTDAKAKELRSLAERLVTLAKRGPDDLAARRRALSVVRDRKVVTKLFDELGPRYADRPGGYTRIVKVETRRGDGAPLSILKFVTEPVTFKERKPRPDDEFEEERPVEEAEPEAEDVVEEAAEEEPAEPETEPEEPKESAGEEEAVSSEGGEEAETGDQEAEEPKDA
jgi:large subunit ribosomal protein L17